MPTPNTPFLRKLRLERLEGRQLMAGDLAPTFADFGVLDQPMPGAGDPTDLCTKPCWIRRVEQSCFLKRICTNKIATRFK